MPYTEKQHKLFEAAAHDPDIAAKRDIPQAQAAKLASEGVKDAAPKIRVRFRKPEARQDAEHWITLHPNGKEANGTRALINGAGQIIGGAGGKLNGKFLNPKTKSGDRPGTEEQHAPAIWLGPANPNAPEGEPGKPETPPAAEPPKVEQPEPPTETAKPEAPKEAESDPETKKLEAKLAQAKEILEKSGKIPDFMRKGMEKEIADLEAKVSERKGIKPPEETKAPEVKAPEPTPPIAEAPKPEPVPEPTPEPIPEPEKPAAEEHQLSKIMREGDEMAANVKTFGEAEAAYKKYREGVDAALYGKMGGTPEAKELQEKMMKFRGRMSELSFEQSDNAKTLEEHEAALAIQRRMYDLNIYSSMKNAHAKAYNDHLKAIKKFHSDKKRAETKVKKAEEKATGVKSKESEIESRYAKSTPDEINKKFSEKYGAGFISKPDTKHLHAEREEIRNRVARQGPHEEGYHESYRKMQELGDKIRSAERYAKVQHFNAVDINAKTQSAKNARKVMAHIEETFDELTNRGYDLRKVFEQSPVNIASGTTGKYGGLAWGANSSNELRHFTIDANKYFDAERAAGIESSNKLRQEKGLPRWNAGNGIRDTIIHELAHAVGMNKSRKSPEMLRMILDQIEPDRYKQSDWVKKNISEYGAKNIHETDAELASMVLNPNYKPGTLPKQLEDHVDWLFMKKGK